MQVGTLNGRAPTRRYLHLLLGRQTTETKAFPMGFELTTWFSLDTDAKMMTCGSLSSAPRRRRYILQKLATHLVL